MKTITCYHCDTQFQSETANDILNQMLPHYMKEHADIMASNSEEDKQKWMENFNKDWDSA